MRKHHPFVSMLLLAASLAAARADVFVGDSFFASPSTPATPDVLHRVSGSGTVLSSAELPLLLSPTQWDTILGPDGWIYAAGNLGLVSRFRPDLSGLEAPWIVITTPPEDDNSQDVAFGPDGRLLVASRGFLTWGLNALVAIDTTTRAIEVLDLPDPLEFEMRGMDVAKAGPLEGGVVLTGRNRGGYFMRRFSRQTDGSLALDGTFGPLDIASDTGCTIDGEPVARPTVHLAFRPDGRTFLVPEGCTNTIKEFDLEGRLVRVVATLEPDPSVSWPEPTEFVENVHVSDDGTIWAIMQRRVWHLDPSGGVLQRVDHLFTYARAACDDHWVPFASDLAGCHGASLGWWKRQCLSLEGVLVPRRGRGRPAGAELPAPRPMPGIDAVRVLSLVTRVDGRLAPFGTTTCEALWNDAPREPRWRALSHLAVLYLNLEDQRLGRRCLVPGTGLDVGGVLDRVEELLALHDAAADAEAARLAQRAVAAHAPDGEDVP
jgi:hypothetical protein